jgi:hypothetical protein
VKIKPAIGFVAKSAKVKVKAIYVGNYAAIGHDACKKARAACAALEPCDEATGGVVEIVYQIC